MKAITPNDPETHVVMRGALTFTIFVRYLVTYKKRVQNRQMRGEGEAATVMIRLGSSAFDLTCSSLSHLQPSCRGKGEEETRPFHSRRKETFAFWSLPPPRKDPFR